MRRRRGFRETLVLAFVAVAVLSIAMMASSTVWLNDRITHDELRGNSVRLARMMQLQLRPAVEFGDMLTAREEIDAVMSDPSVQRIEVYGVDGELLAARGDASSATGEFEIKAPVAGGGNKEGRLVLRVSGEHIRAERKRSLFGALGVTLVVVLSLVLAMAITLARRISRRVWRLKRETERIASGELDQPLANIEGTDEIAELALNIDTMRARLATLFRESLEKEATERERLQQLLDEHTAKLRHKQRELSLILDNAKFTAFNFNVDDGVFSYLSAGSSENLGVEVDDASPIAALFSPEVLASLRKSSEDASEIEIVAELPVGRRELRIIGGSDNESGREVLRGVIFDVTEQRKLERELASAQRLETVGRLAAGVAHEINTPMQYIGDNVSFLQKSFARIGEVMLAVSEKGDDEIMALMTKRRVPKLQKRIPNAIEQTLEGIDNVSRIVSAMKAFTHPGSGEAVPTNLDELLRTTATVSRNEWKYVAQLEFDIEDGLPPVPCLASELRQCVLNMIVNAAQAMNGREGGQIGISARSTSFGVEVRVKDNAGGIPVEIVDRVFDPFFTTKPVGVGTGQGLAISHDIIVNKHEGRLSLENVPGEGATFVIELPVDNSAEKDAA